jgi:hypothetical protein
MRSLHRHVFVILDTRLTWRGTARSRPPVNDLLNHGQPLVNRIL